VPSIKLGQLACAGGKDNHPTYYVNTIGINIGWGASVQDLCIMCNLCMGLDVSLSIRQKVNLLEKRRLINFSSNGKWKCLIRLLSFTCILDHAASEKNQSHLLDDHAPIRASPLHMPKLFTMRPYGRHFGGWPRLLLAIFSFAYTGICHR